MIFFANDFPGPVIDYSMPREPLQPLFSNRWHPRLLYIASRIRQDQTVPRRWITKPFPFLAAVPHESNPWSSEERAKQYEKFVEPTIASAMKRGQFNPFIVDQYVRIERRFRAEIDVHSLIEQLQAYLSRQGVQVMIAYLPHRDQVSNAYLNYERLYVSNKSPTSLEGKEYQIHAQALATACAALGVPFLDLTPAVRTAEAQGERLYWRYDPHMNERGYALVASTLFEWRERIDQ